MSKQAIKKGTGIHKVSGIGNWKSSHGMSVETPKEGAVVKVSNLSSANKPQSWIIMPKCFQDVTKLPGIPENTMVCVMGHTNVGKTTLINHAIAAAQKQGLIPVIIDTENAFSFQYAQQMGFECTPIYGDVEIEDVNTETGEITTHVENRIIEWEGNFVYYNNKILAERFGDIDYQSGGTLTGDKKRTVAVVEDVAQAILELLDAQDAGEINQGFLFCWDSVGSIGCFKEYSSKSKTGNAMWTAAAIAQAFSPIVNDRIPRSKKASCKYNNTFMYINRIWLAPQLVGPPSLETKGGKSLMYSARVCIHLGKTMNSGIKRLTATTKGVNYGYGIQTHIKVTKNHLDAPHNVCYEGELIATDTGFIGVDELETYKKQHLSEIVKKLNSLSFDQYDISEQDVEFTEEDEGAAIE
jgi:RecA/RadA recombinase